MATESRPVMTWQTDATGNVRRANRACCEFLGLSEAELRAGAWNDRIHPEDRADYLRSREKAIAESETYRNSVRFLNSRGEYSLVSITLAPYWDDDGNVAAWHAIAEVDEGLIKRSA